MLGLEVGSAVKEKQTKPVVIRPGVAVGGQEVILMAGPCAVESYEQTRLAAAPAAIAAGADGLLVEIHPYPSQALSDAEQALPLAALPQLVKEVGQISRAMGRTLL